jgi:hypothetical protein
MPNEKKEQRQVFDRSIRLTLCFSAKGILRSVSLPARVTIHQSAEVSDIQDTRLPIQTPKQGLPGFQDHREVTSAKVFLESLQKEYLARLSTKAKRRS